MAVYVVDHPLVRHKLGILRMESTSTREFRTVANEVARLLIYEATKNFRTEKHMVRGWAGPVEVEAISGKKVTVVPILRAGRVQGQSRSSSAFRVRSSAGSSR